MISKEDLEEFKKLKKEIATNNMFNDSNTDSTVTKELLDGFLNEDSTIPTFYIARFSNLDSAVQELEKMSSNLKRFTDNNSNYSYTKSFKHDANLDSDTYEVKFTIHYNDKSKTSTENN